MTGLAGVMRIASWNVNSLKARQGLVLDWLAREQPDAACLQELKLVEDAFPFAAFQELGYHAAVLGQKAWNGVAILSKTPLEGVLKGLPGDDADEQARYIEATVTGPTPVRVASVYLPNGNPIGTEKFAYKLAWFARLQQHAAGLLERGGPLVITGDFNVIPDEQDAKKPYEWLEDALFRPESRAAWRDLKAIGLVDAYEKIDGKAGGYTFFAYTMLAWQRKNGIRIDHALLSPDAVTALRAFDIHRDERGKEKPSDHVPVVVTLDL